MGMASFFLIAKILDLSEFAVYAIFLFVSEILSILLSHGFYSYVLRNSDKEIREDVFPKSLFIIICTFLAFLVLYLLSSPFLVVHLSSSYQALDSIFTLVLAIVFSQTIIRMHYGYLVSNHLAKEHMHTTITHGCCKLLFTSFIIFFPSGGSLQLVLFSLLAANVSTLVFSASILDKLVTPRVIGLREAISLIYDASPFMLKMIIKEEVKDMIL